MSMILKTEKIIKEWTDYNEHMNVAYYVHVFDIAADIMLDNFKMGGESAKKDKKKYYMLIKAYQMHYRQSLVSGKLDLETYNLILSHYNEVLTKG